MENWAFSAPMLKQYAVHHQTSAVMPDHMIAKIRKSATFNEGFNTTELLAAALSDFDIHSVQSAEQIDVAEFERKSLTEKRGLIPQIEPRYHYTYFSHIFDGGYSAGYYFYIWAEVLDKDAFQAFVESGDLFDRATAERLRGEILSKGGSRDGMDMYRAFRGADPDKRAMLVARGLVKDEEQVAEPVSEPQREVTRINSREQARQRAERSRQEREAARTEAEVEAQTDSIQVNEETK
jgi:peptidyl-dipeptidase Dcp